MSPQPTLATFPTIADVGIGLADRDRKASARRASRATAGFSLLEILVVLAIIGLIVGVAVTNLGSIFGGAQAKVAKLFVTSEVELPLMAYKADMGDYPTTEEGGLTALWVAPSSKAGNWHGPYGKGSKAPLDPWNEPYQYRYPGTHNKGSYDIWSKGPDKQDGTEDDIGNW
jgi:general secretion pathway protein G